MKKEKQLFTKISVPLAALLAGLLLIGATFSLLSGVTPTLTNIFQIGSVKTELMEPGFQVEGTRISKNPFVTNVGDVDCIVRLKIEVSPAEIEVPMSDNPSCKEQAGWNAELEAGEADRLWQMGYRFWLNFNTRPDDNVGKACWLYHAEDGYWYYQRVLAPAEDTSELFTEVKWLLIENGYFKEIQDFDIYIKKESTFASYMDETGLKHNATSEGVYNQSNAMNIWSYMESEGKIF